MAPEGNPPDKPEAADDTPEEEGAEVVREALEEAAEGEEGERSEVMRGMMAQLQQFGPPPHPLADQITSDHIDSLIEVQRRNSDNLLEDRKDQRSHAKAVLVIVGILLLALVGLLGWIGSVDQVESLVRLLVIAAGGAFGGWGYARGRQ